MAEQRQHAARAQRIQAALESGLRDRIVNHVHTAAFGKALHLIGVNDGFVAAVLARDARFLFGRYGAEHVRAEHLRHLHDETAGAARRRVHQAGVASLQRKRGMRQVMRRHALQQGRGGGREVHVVGNLHKLRRGHHGVFGVRAAHGAVGHAVAGRDLGHRRADGFDRAGGLLANGQGEVGFVKSGAEIDVDEIDAGGGDAHQRLVSGGLRNRKFHQLQLFRAARLLHLNGFHNADRLLKT